MKDDDQKPILRRGRGRLRVAVAIVFAILLVSSTAVTAAYAFVYRKLTPATVEEIASRSLSRSVSIDSLSFAGWKGIRLGGFAIHETDTGSAETAVPMAEFDEITVRPDLFSILRGNIEVGSVTSSGGLLRVRRNPVSQEWNFVRLINEITERSGRSSARVKLRNLAVYFEDVSPFNSSPMHLSSLTFDPISADARAVITGFGTEPAAILITANSDRKELKVIAEDIPATITSALTPGVSFSAIELNLKQEKQEEGGSIILADGRARDLSLRNFYSGSTEFGSFSIANGKIRYGESRGDWGLSFDKIEIETKKDERPARLTGQLSGNSYKIATADISGSGFIETILRILPQEFREKTNQYRPAGRINATLKYAARIGVRPEILKVRTTFEGVSLTVPAGTVFPTNPLSSTFEIQNIRGELATDGSQWDLNNLTLSVGGDPMSFSGRIRASSGPLDYALKVKSTRMLSDNLAPFIGSTASVSGPIGFDLALSPLAAEGTVHFHNNILRLPALKSALTNLDGSITLDRQSVSTDGVKFRAGESNFSVSGAVSNFSDPTLEKVKITAKNARLEDLSSLLPGKLSPVPAGAEIHGGIDIDGLQISGPLSRADWRGKIALSNASGKLAQLVRGAEMVSGELLFNGDRVIAREMSGTIGGSTSRIEGSLRLAPPYEIDLKIGLNAANIDELFTALPGAGAVKSLGIDGNAIVTAKLNYTGDKLTLSGGLFDGELKGFGMDFRDVSGEFRYESPGDVLVMSSLAGSWAAGRTQDGWLKLNLAAETPTFEARGSVKGADLNRLLNQTGFSTQNFRGTIGGEFDVNGRIGDKRSLAGTGRIEISQGRFAELKPLESIARALTLDFFSREGYQTVTGEFVAENGRIQTAGPKHLRFQGKNYLLEAAGYTTLDGVYVYEYNCGIDAGAAGRLLTLLPVGVDGRGEIIRKRGTIQGKL